MSGEPGYKPAYNNEQTKKIVMEVTIVTTTHNTDAVMEVALNQLRNAFGGNVTLGWTEVKPV